VLKLLQKSYHKKVKMIYIDPPYNTGKDFIYPDHFRDNIKISIVQRVERRTGSECLRHQGFARVSYPSSGANRADRPMIMEIRKLSTGFHKIIIRIVRKK